MTPEQKAEVSRLRKEAAKKRKLWEVKGNREDRDDDPMNDRQGNQFGCKGQDKKKTKAKK